MKVFACIFWQVCVLVLTRCVCWIAVIQILSLISRSLLFLRCSSFQQKKPLKLYLFLQIKQQAHCLQMLHPDVLPPLCIRILTTRYDSHMLTYLKWMNICRYRIYAASPKNKPWSYLEVPFVCSNYHSAKITKVNPTTQIKPYWLGRQSLDDTRTWQDWMPKLFLQKGKWTLSMTSTKQNHSIVDS